MNFLSENGDLIWKLYKGEKIIQNRMKIRHGYGWQLFLNGYQYFGNWFNNKANGKGFLIFPDKSYFIGDFENNKIKNGKMIYEWGSEFSGKYDENQNFLEGEFILDVDYNLRVKFREGNIIYGFLYNKNNDDDNYEINFKNFRSHQTVFQDENIFKIHIDREIIIQKNGIIKLQIKKKKRFDGNIQNFVIINPTPFIYIKKSENVITQKIHFNKKIENGLYYKQSWNSKCFLYDRFGFKIPTNLINNKIFKNEKIVIPFLNNDYILIEEGCYKNFNLFITKGIYKKNNSFDNSEDIFVKNLSKISDNELILEKKIDFKIFLSIIHSKKNGIKQLTNKIINKYFFKKKKIFDLNFENNNPTKNFLKNKNLILVQTSEAIQNNNIFGNFNNPNLTKIMNQNNDNTMQYTKKFQKFNNELIIEKLSEKKYSEKKQKKKFENFQFSLFKNFIFHCKNKKKEKVQILNSSTKNNFFFKGNILYNQKEGYCYIRNEDGSDIRGFYKKGKKNGFCCKRDPKGIIIQGFYKEDIPYGKFEKINLKGEKILGLYNGTIFKRQRTNFYEGNKIEYYSLENKDIIDGDCELILDKFRIKCCFVNGKIKYSQKVKICVINENSDENELFEGDMILGKKELKGFFKERKENGKVWDIDLKKKIIKFVP